MPPSPLLALTSMTAAAADCLPCETGQLAVGVPSSPLVTADAPAPTPQTSAQWVGVIGVEGEATGDGRMIEANALVWDVFPLPLRYVPQDVGAHDGAVVVGQIDSITRAQGGQLQSEGSFDLEAPYGPEAQRVVGNGTQNGVSMDLDDVSFEVRVQADVLSGEDPVLTALMDGTPPPQNPDGTVTVATINSTDELMVTTSARVRAATIVAIPAFDTARITLAQGTGPMMEPSVGGDGGAAPLDAPSAGLMPDGKTKCSCDDGAPGYDPGCECAPASDQAPPPPALAASAAPDAPPAAWFSRPTFTEPTALNVTAQGQVFGHLAAWGTCHISHMHSGCVTPPHSAAGYAYFHTGTVLTAEGAEVPVGHITLDTLHAGERMTAAAAASHYENTGSVVADVTAGEDEFGIWVAGALRPAATAAQVRALRSAPLSGDWRRMSGNLELIAALAVVVPGFPVPRPRGLVAGGVTQTLLASGMVPPRTVRRPGTEGALSLDDLRYLKLLADRERREESLRAAGPLPAAVALARRVRASSLVMRAHRRPPILKEN